MRITVIGTGYVGLVTGACLADLGNQVICMDVDQQKINHLQQGIIPIYEPGLEEVVLRNSREGRLQFITDLNEQLEESEVYYVAVGTPCRDSGAADLQYVLSAVRMIGQRINSYCVIIDKSTVPVGVAHQVSAAITQELAARDLNIDFDVVSNPEFLKEGAAIEDFMKPDRLVVGCATEKARVMMDRLYAPIVRNNGGKMLYMGVKDAEMCKYAVNAMLATRISFMNEIAMLCEKFDVDVDNVRAGIGSDSRIGEKFLSPGAGYGGSCFPKDVKALVYMARQRAFEPLILSAVEARNAQQKQVLVDKIHAYFGDDLSGIRIALWGLSFKPGTDDMREASSVVFLEQVIAKGAVVCAYDPVAQEVAKRDLPSAWFDANKLRLVEQQYCALDQADVLVIMTEWPQFLHPHFKRIKESLAQPVILDGRNLYDPIELASKGFVYSGIGRGLSTEALYATAPAPAATAPSAVTMEEMAYVEND
jgi:UDPglucose 6-dehydrogenase